MTGNSPAAGIDRLVIPSPTIVIASSGRAACSPHTDSGTPAFAQAARELEPRVRLAKLNTEDQQAIAARYAIRSIPTMVLFKGGREVARISGALGAADIERWVRSVL